MTPIYKKHIAQRVQELLDSYIAEGRLPTTIYYPRGSHLLPHSMRVSLPPVRRGLDAAFLTHEVRLVPACGDSLEATLMPKVSDRIAALRDESLCEYKELEAIELTAYEAAVLLLEQRERVSFYNAFVQPEDTEWTGCFMGIPLRLENPIENNDF